MLSLGGGLPNPDAFPIAGLSITVKPEYVDTFKHKPHHRDHDHDGGAVEADRELPVSAENVRDALQYLPTEGFVPLVKWLREEYIATFHRPQYGAVTVPVLSARCQLTWLADSL